MLLLQSVINFAFNLAAVLTTVTLGKSRFN